MRSSVSALEGELAPPGFLRTCRSWLVNAKRVAGLKPAGSGDYEVEVTTLTVPLSGASRRRWPGQERRRLTKRDYFQSVPIGSPGRDESK